MKNSFYFLSLLFALLFQQNGYGQSNQVVLEQVQMYSSIRPDGKYWQPSKMQVENFAKGLDSSLFNPLGLKRETAYPIQTKIINKPNQIGKLVIDWSNSTLVPYHAYLEIYELAPEQTFGNQMVDIEIPKKDSIQSTWFMTCTILDQQKNALFQKTILIGMIPFAHEGIGYPINIPVTTPTHLFNALQTGLKFFDTKSKGLEYIEAKVPISFATDNFLMPLLQSKSSIKIDTTKGFMQYTLNGARVVLRVPNAVMNKIDTKDKSANNPFYEVMPAIKKRTSTLFKEYYQAIQPLRNVGLNKDYTLEAYIEFNPMIDPELRATPPIRFLSDSLHKIYADTNLIGRFKVMDQISNTGWTFNSNEIYNGYDSTTIYKLNTGYPKGLVQVAKVIEGSIGKDSFKIVFNQDIDVRIIYLNQVAIFVAYGQNKPSKLIPLVPIVQNSISSLLLLMAYSEIFQSPN
jgi:hypothetical protein